MNPTSEIHWQENDAPHSALWQSENGSAVPRKIIVADDRMAADTAYRLACEGTALLWRGDFQNARMLLQALARRIDRKTERKPAQTLATPQQAFHQHRHRQTQRAHILGMLLIPVEAGFHIPLRRAPDMREACAEVYSHETTDFVVSLRELQGIVGAHEWRKKGVEIAELSARIHPHYGVFSPVRGEYLALVAQAPLPVTDLAIEIGAGTGVLSALLTKRGVRKVIATECDPRALACANDNITRLGLQEKIELREQNMFPSEQAKLIVCNPPWLPARPNAAIEYALYDPDSRMLKAFLHGLQQHLLPGGEAWLILSDLAEHLGLRSRQTLLDWIAEAGLRVVARLDTKPRHARVTDASDPLHQARSAEITSLWRLSLSDSAH